jgi:hypothetical protein
MNLNQRLLFLKTKLDYIEYLCVVMIKPIFGHKIGSFFTVFSFALHFSGKNGLLSLPFFLLPSVFGHVWAPFFTVFPFPLRFRERMGTFLYRFSFSPLFSGMYGLPSLPFFLFHFIFGNVWAPFFTVFPSPLRFWERMGFFLYRFSFSSSFSGTNRLPSLPFFLFLSIFGNVWVPFFTVFPSPLGFRERIGSLLYRFSFSSSRFSGMKRKKSLIPLLQGIKLLKIHSNQNHFSTN